MLVDKDVSRSKKSRRCSKTSQLPPTWKSKTFSLWKRETPSHQFTSCMPTYRMIWDCLKQILWSKLETSKNSLASFVAHKSCWVLELIMPLYLSASPRHDSHCHYRLGSKPLVAMEPEPFQFKWIEDEPTSSLKKMDKFVISLFCYNFIQFFKKPIISTILKKKIIKKIIILKK